jgi:hypothetical protein
MASRRAEGAYWSADPAAYAVQPQFSNSFTVLISLSQPLHPSHLQLMLEEDTFLSTRRLTTRSKSLLLKRKHLQS